MTDMKNIYDVLDEIGFENQCEKYALGFHRDTDTPTMTKFRQESMKEFCFSLIQQYAEKVYEDFIRTRKALNVAIDALNKYTDASGNWWYGYEFQGDYENYAGEYANKALEQITALEQKE